MKKRPKPMYRVTQNIFFMLKLAWTHRKSVIFFCLLTALLTLGIHLIQLYLVPIILRQVEMGAPLQYVLTLILLFTLALVVARVLLSYLSQVQFLGRLDVRTKIFLNLMQKKCTTSYPHTQDPDFMKLEEAAMETCGGDNAQASEAIWESLTQIGINLASFIIYLLVLSNLNPLLLFVICIAAILSYGLSRRIQLWGYIHRNEEGEYLQKINYLYNQSKNKALAKDVRLFNLGPWISEIYTQTLRLYDAFIQRQERKYFAICLTDTALYLIRTGTAYGYLLYITLTQQLPASEFLLYFTAFNGFATWISKLLENYTQLYQQSLELCSLREYLNTPEPFLLGGGRNIPIATTYELRLENITFSYPSSATPIFKHFNLTLRAGEKLAIVGLNGAGKSTLVKLLCGLYDPDEGRVLLNGIDIRTFNRTEYYRLFSAVFQDFSLLNITLAQTVAQSITHIQDTKVEDCLQAVDLWNAVQQLPQKLQSILGKEIYDDGITLSGGQTQRLMMARALYKDAPFLFLDEPTAALDPIAESAIYQEYQHMTNGKTSLFISHRLASTRFCDRILFLQNGTIIEEGTHNDLLQRGGAYAKLFTVQARYYQEGDVSHEATYKP